MKELRKLLQAETRFITKGPETDLLHFIGIGGISTCNEECIICQTTVNGKFFRFPCNHRFCCKCMDQHLKVSNACPLCRADFPYMLLRMCLKLTCAEFIDSPLLSSLPLPILMINVHNNSIEMDVDDIL